MKYELDNADIPKRYNELRQQISKHEDDLRVLRGRISDEEENLKNAKVLSEKAVDRYIKKLSKLEDTKAIKL
jgi:predicted  nucleic acid-binding Zn-ribbon protein